MNTRKKRIYAAVLTAALGILAVDQLWISPPQDANASADALATAQPGTPAMAGGGPHPSTFTLALAFPQHLPQPESHGASRRNPFEPPPAFVRQVQHGINAPQPSAPAGTRHPGQPLTVAAFHDAHTLRGVILGTPGVAMVDGAAVEVGQTFDGSLLLSVERDAANFQCADGVATLRLR